MVVDRKKKKKVELEEEVGQPMHLVLLSSKAHTRDEVIPIVFARFRSCRSKFVHIT
jgi:hypothetical protein